MLLFVGGCAAASVLIDKVSPPPKVDAQYVPAKDTMLVLVESYNNPSSVAVASEQLDREIANHLIERRFLDTLAGAGFEI